MSDPQAKHSFLKTYGKNQRTESGNRMEYSRYEGIKELAGSGNVLFGESMKKHTSFRIGGPADCMVNITGEEALCKVTEYCRKEAVPYFILGNGTNLLVSDLGFRGVVLKVQKGFQEANVEGERIVADAGVLLSSLGRLAAEHSLTGLEFASGIPGTLGGALVMNAGAYGGELKDVLEEVKILKPGKGIETVPVSDMNMGYRTSILKHTDWIAAGAVIRLEKGRIEEIEGEMERLKNERIAKQPLDIPSAGSTFKRPEGYFAGKLIMDAGLRGFSVGGAAVSEKHCGFVVNKGGATALDVKMLIREIVRRVEENAGVRLTPEVRFLGDFPF